MIFKYSILVVIALLQSFSLYSQKKTYKLKSEIFCDVDSFPVFRFDTLDNKEVIKYYLIKEELVSVNIQFAGGYDALTNFCDSLYYNRKDYNYDELNARALFTILFDQDLRIKEIKILKRMAYNNLKYNYDGLIKKILLSTEGQWIKNDNKSKWYFYFGYFDLR